MTTARCPSFCRGLKAGRLTQVDVARAFGRAQSFTFKIERGEIRIDPIELQRFAELWGGGGGASVSRSEMSREAMPHCRSGWRHCDVHGPVGLRRETRCLMRLQLHR